MRIKAFGEQISAVVAQGEQKSTTNRFYMPASNPLKYVDPTEHYSVEIFEPDGNSLEEKIKFEGGGGVEIHFVYNKITGAYDDFKFK